MEDSRDMHLLSRGNNGNILLIRVQLLPYSEHCRHGGKERESAHQSQKPSTEGWGLGLTI